MSGPFDLEFNTDSLSGGETFVSKGIEPAGAVFGPTQQCAHGSGDDDADDGHDEAGDDADAPFRVGRQNCDGESAHLVSCVQSLLTLVLQSVCLFATPPLPEPYGQTTHVISLVDFGLKGHFLV